MDKIHLEAFEGPLDLLLHLIKKKDVDIYNIPIGELLGQYLEYLNLAKDLNIDLAGEFIEMASELTFIKSKMLLPEPPVSEEDEGVDPRADLVAKLLEYQRYKLAAQQLIRRPVLGRDVFVRPTATEESTNAEVEGPSEVMVEVDSMSLLSAFQELLKRLPAKTVHEMNASQRMGVAERILEMTESLQGRERVAFEELFSTVATRSDLVVTFLAILEMTKQRLLRILQESTFGKIYVFPLFSGDDASLQDIKGDIHGTHGTTGRPTGIASEDQTYH